MKSAQEIKQITDRLMPGKTTSMRTDATFIQIRLSGSGYLVECGWAVPAREDSDWESYTTFPFAGNRRQPWAGRQLPAATSAQAADIYVRFRDAIMARQIVAEGMEIGPS